MTPALRQAFAEQAMACADLGSPFMAQMLPLVLDVIRPASRLGQRLSDWPEDRLGPRFDSVPLRMAGGLHALVLQGDADLARAYPPETVSDQQLRQALTSALKFQENHMLDWLGRPPQTNEVRRSAGLIAAANWLTATAGKMLVVSELGASAGLNLAFDYFALDLPRQSYGSRLSKVRLSPRWTGPTPPVCPPYVHDAQGCDLTPLDAKEPSDQLRLLSYLWPDQPERLDRTRAAIDLLENTPTKANAADWLAERLAQFDDRYLHLVYTTVAWQYFDAADQARILAMLDETTTPTALLRIEADDQTPGAGITLRLWPDRQNFDLGRMDFHGRWVDWQAPAV